MVAPGTERAVNDWSLSLSVSSRGGPRAYQAIEAAAKEVHSSHLHRRGGQGRPTHRGAEVQVEEVTQQVALGRDDVRLLTRGGPSRGRLRAFGALAPLRTQDGGDQQGWGRAASESPVSRILPQDRHLRLRDVPEGAVCAPLLPLPMPDPSLLPSKESSFMEMTEGRGRLLSHHSATLKNRWGARPLPSQPLGRAEEEGESGALEVKEWSWSSLCWVWDAVPGPQALRAHCPHKQGHLSELL